MAHTNQRLLNSLKHNRELIHEIEASGIQHLFNTGIIRKALYKIEQELRMRGVPF